MAIAEGGDCIPLGSLISGNVWIALLEQSCGTALLHKSSAASLLSLVACLARSSVYFSSPNFIFCTPFHCKVPLPKCVKLLPLSQADPED